MIEDIDEDTVNNLLTRVVRKRDVDGERAQELFEGTVETVQKVIEEDEYAYLESEKEARAVAAVSVYTLLTITDNSFEQAWREFNEEESTFDIGLMYQTVFPERAESVLQQATNDYDN